MHLRTLVQQRVAAQRLRSADYLAITSEAQRQWRVRSPCKRVWYTSRGGQVQSAESVGLSMAPVRARVRRLALIDTNLFTGLWGLHAGSEGCAHGESQHERSDRFFLAHDDVKM